MPENEFYIHRETGQIFHFTEFKIGSFTLNEDFEIYMPPKWLVKTSEPNKGKFFSWNIYLAERDDMEGCEYTPEEQAKQEAIIKAELKASMPRRVMNRKIESPVYKISQKSRKRMKEKMREATL